jgi:hypothetical protein
VRVFVVSLAPLHSTLPVYAGETAPEMVLLCPRASALFMASNRACE